MVMEAMPGVMQDLHTLEHPTGTYLLRKWTTIRLNRYMEDLSPPITPCLPLAWAWVLLEVAGARITATRLPSRHNLLISYTTFNLLPKACTTIVSRRHLRLSKEWTTRHRRHIIINSLWFTELCHLCICHTLILLPLFRP